MPALVAGIHVFLMDRLRKKDVAGRVKSGHDETKSCAKSPPLRYPLPDASMAQRGLSQ
jgi:hypothetical protein